MSAVWMRAQELGQPLMWRDSACGRSPEADVVGQVLDVDLEAADGASEAGFFAVVGSQPAAQVDLETRGGVAVGRWQHHALEPMSAVWMRAQELGQP